MTTHASERFSVETVDDLDAAREAVLARIPAGASAMTNTSVTLQETGIADAIDGAPYDSARNIDDVAPRVRERVAAARDRRPSPSRVVGVGRA